MMKRILVAIALTCALSGAALAGDIPSTDKPAPATSSPIVSAIATIIRIVAR